MIAPDGAGEWFARDRMTWTPIPSSMRVECLRRFETGSCRLWIRPGFRFDSRNNGERNLWIDFRSDKEVLSLRFDGDPIVRATVELIDVNGDVQILGQIRFQILWGVPARMNVELCDGDGQVEVIAQLTPRSGGILECIEQFVDAVSEELALRYPRANFAR